MKKKFLIIDDDITFTHVLSRALTKRGYNVANCQNDIDAIHLAENFQPEYISLDLKLADVSGLSLLPDLIDILPDSKIVILTGYSSIATAVEAIKLGALDYLCKPVDTDEILATFNKDATEVKEVELPSEPMSVNRLTWEHIQKVLQENEGNISATARALNMHRRTLQRKLQKRPTSK